MFMCAFSYYGLSENAPVERTTCAHSVNRVGQHRDDLHTCVVCGQRQGGLASTCCRVFSSCAVWRSPSAVTAAITARSCAGPIVLTTISDMRASDRYVNLSHACFEIVYSIDEPPAVQSNGRRRKQKRTNMRGPYGNTITGASYA